MKSILPLALLALLSACAGTPQSIGFHRPDVRTSRAQFELLKSLEGDWAGPAGETMEGQPLEARYRVTANGTAVQETLFPGSPHEMVTMYHLDGERLMLTHYCSAGNQPRMVATNWEMDTKPQTIRFAFHGATNLASSKTGHMHEMEMTVESPDRYTATWTYYQDGMPAHQATFQMTRKGAAPKAS